MTTTLWIVCVISIVFVLGFVLSMRSLLRENREIDKKIDYRKVNVLLDDEEDS